MFFLLLSLLWVQLWVFFAVVVAVVGAAVLAVGLAALVAPVVAVVVAVVVLRRSVNGFLSAFLLMQPAGLCERRRQGFVIVFPAFFSDAAFSDPSSLRISRGLRRIVRAIANTAVFFEDPVLGGLSRLKREGKERKKQERKS